MIYLNEWRTWLVCAILPIHYYSAVAFSCPGRLRGWTKKKRKGIMEGIRIIKRVDEWIKLDYLPCGGRIYPLPYTVFIHGDFPEAPLFRSLVVDSNMVKLLNTLSCPVLYSV
jgi:hypothetical protein